MGYLRGYFSGSCPTDAKQIHLSQSAQSNPTTAELINNKIYTDIPSNGRFDFWYRVDNNLEYTVWCETETDENLIIETQTTEWIEEDWGDDEGDEDEEEDEGCLSGDTLITMSDGSLKKMEEIVPGDFIMSPTGVVKVLGVSNNHFSPFLISYVFEDGTIIEETGPHRFYNN
jgi:hypothetical protein